MADKSKAAMPAIMAIIAKKKGAPAQDEPDGDEGSQEDEQGHVTAAADVLTAIKDGDPQALSDALYSFVELCKE